MKIGDHIWNEIYSENRITEARTPLFPSSSLHAWLDTIIEEFGELNFTEVISHLAKLHLSKHVKIGNDPIGKQINDACSRRRNSELEKIISLNRISVNDNKRALISFSKDRGIKLTKSGEAFIWEFHNGKYDIVAQFIFKGLPSGVEYDVRIYPTGAVRSFRNSVYYFVSEMLQGYGTGRWDMIQEESDLHFALDKLNNDCLFLAESLSKMRSDEVRP
jgi:hypothetical protein